MKSLFIKGEAEKALDDTRRFFHEVAEGGTLSFTSQSNDTLNIAIAPKYINGNGANLPEVGQEITLEIDDVRIFTGVVTGVPASLAGDGMKVNVTISGPWWWLDNAPITEEITEEERPQFECPKGDLRANLTAILNRAISQGLPIAIGTIEACYDAPTVTFQGGSFASAIAELVRLVPDAVIWWDYSGSGHPKFNLTRRNSKNPTTLRIGTDAIESLSLNPEWSLSVNQVSVPYAARRVDGSLQFKSQSSDQSGYGQRQVIAVSGPELTDFVPPDPISSQTITSEEPFGGGGSKLEAPFLNNWPLWKKITAIHADTPPTMKAFDSGVAAAAHYAEGIAPDYFLDNGTKITSSTPKRFLARNSELESLPQWLIDQLGLVKGFMKGTWYCETTYPAGTPVWDSMNGLERELRQSLAYYRQVNNDPIEVTMWFDVEFPVYFMASEVTDKTYYQPLAYDYEEPPVDFAKNLRDAQNWLPYSGSILLQRENHGFSRMIGQTINIDGGLPPWEAMGALVQGESYDLFSQKQDLSLGVPTRLRGRTPVHRVSRQGSDSIVIN